MCTSAMFAVTLTANQNSYETRVPLQEGRGSAMTKMYCAGCESCVLEKRVGDSNVDPVLVSGFLSKEQPMQNVTYL